MDYADAIEEVLERAAAIKLPGHRIDVVTAARREFARGGGCDSKLIEPIEETLRACLQQWSLEEKREIWLSTETGAQSDPGLGELHPDSIDMDLEGELMYHLIELLSSPQPNDAPS